MADNISKLLIQSPVTRWFFIVVGTVFTAIAGWGFVMDIQNGLTPGNALQSIPSDLKTMCLSIYGFIAAGFEKSIDKIETTLGKDLDGDGDVGGNVVSSIITSQPIVNVPVFESVQPTPIINVENPITISPISSGANKVLTGAEATNI